MTTDTIETAPRPKAWRIVAMLAATVAIFAGLCIVAGGAANAAPPIYIGAGTQIIPEGGGGCNVAYANQATRLAVTAGHCGPVGMRFFNRAGKYVGKVITRQAPTDTNPVGPNTRDYAVFKLARNVVVINEPVRLTGIATPQVGMAVYKYGHGWNNQLIRYGKIVAVTPIGIVVDGMATIAFDSGSPIVTLDGKIVAVVSGLVGIDNLISNGVAALNRIPGLPVKAGYSVGTRVDKVAGWTGVQPS